MLALVILSACNKHEKKEAPKPWQVKEIDSLSNSDAFSLSDIIEHGEMIVLTMSGPETFYTYRDKSLGSHYMLCEDFAKRLGVSLRVELCHDTTELVNRLRKGDGDLIAFPLKRDVKGGDSLLFCGPNNEKWQWAVTTDNKELADTLNRWFADDMIHSIRVRERFILTMGKVQHRENSQVLDSVMGRISSYDDLFRKYAPVARIDWRLMAAICYQESCFDPDAKSWAGACGLMQIMPSTAEELGLPLDQIFESEPNIQASAKYLSELSVKFRDIPDPAERINFVLAAYNCGPNHVRDAMALTEKYEGNKHVWDDVAPNILNLSEAKYYLDPVVRAGYMRGTETFNYVANIRRRYKLYTGIALGEGAYEVYGPGRNGVSSEPKRAKKKNKKFKV